MSLHCEEIIEEIDGALHEHAVAMFAQVLADCESTSWTVAQQAHEYCAEMVLSMGFYDYDQFLTEATEYMVANELRPNTWLPG